MPARAGCIYRAAGVVSIGGTAGLLRQGLRTDEAGIEPVLRQKLGMGALLDGFPVGHGDDEVGVAHGREPMGDDDGGAATAEAGERLLHQRLAFGVQRAGGFIEQQDAGVAEQGAGQSDALALATGEALTAGADAGGEAFRQVGDEAGGGGFGGFGDFGRAGSGRGGI